MACDIPLLRSRGIITIPYSFLLLDFLFILLFGCLLLHFGGSLHLLFLLLLLIVFGSLRLLRDDVQPLEHRLIETTVYCIFSDYDSLISLNFKHILDNFIQESD